MQPLAAPTTSKVAVEDGLHQRQACKIIKEPEPEDTQSTPSSFSTEIWRDRASSVEDSESSGEDSSAAEDLEQVEVKALQCSFATPDSDDREAAVQVLLLESERQLEFPLSLTSAEQDNAAPLPPIAKMTPIDCEEDSITEESESSSSTSLTSARSSKSSSSSSTPSDSSDSSDTSQSTDSSSSSDSSSDADFDVAEVDLDQQASGDTDSSSSSDSSSDEDFDAEEAELDQQASDFNSEEAELDAQASEIAMEAHEDMGTYPGFSCTPCSPLETIQEEKLEEAVERVVPVEQSSFATDDAKHREHAAVRLQKVERGRQARSAYRRHRSAIITLQAWRRGKKQRAHFVQIAAAIVFLQVWVRKNLITKIGMNESVPKEPVVVHLPMAQPLVKQRFCQHQSDSQDETGSKDDTDDESLPGIPFMHKSARKTRETLCFCRPDVYSEVEPLAVEFPAAQYQTSLRRESTPLQDSPHVPLSYSWWQSFFCTSTESGICTPDQNKCLQTKKKGKCLPSEVQDWDDEVTVENCTSSEIYGL